jgi:hypothetical protein
MAVSVSDYWWHICAVPCPVPHARSTDETWKGAIGPKGADWCYKFRSRTGVPTTGETISGKPKPCDGWRHRPCAEAKAHRKLAQLSHAIADIDEVWVAFAEHHDELMPRLRQRRQAAYSTGGFWVQRIDGLMVLVFDRELPGTEAPARGHMKTPEQVLFIVSQVGLRLPGVAKTGFLGGWNRPSPTKKQALNTGNMDLGSFTDEHFEKAFELAAAEANRQWGVEVWPARLLKGPRCRCAIEGPHRPGPLLRR